MNSPLSPFLEKENEDGEIDQIPMLKTFTMFSVEQIDCLPLGSETASSTVMFESLPQAENPLRRSGASIIENGQNAVFKPSTGGTPPYE